MKISPFKFILGFICLFLLYHTAEYMIIFKKNPAGFLVFQGFFFAAAWLIAQWQFKQSLSAWGLNTRKYFLRHLLMGMVMGVLLYGLTYFINLITGVEQKTFVPPATYLATQLLIFVFGNFFSSFSEDILTRGYLYKHFGEKLSVPVFIFISAAVYLLNHVYRLGDGFVTYLYLFLLGVLFVIPLVLTKRLWFTGGMHWAGNSFFFLTHGLIQTDSGNTSFSPNITLCICIVLMIPVNYYILKKTNLIDTEYSKKVPMSVA